MIAKSVLKENSLMYRNTSLWLRSFLKKQCTRKLDDAIKFVDDFTILVNLLTMDYILEHAMNSIF